MSIFAGPHEAVELVGGCFERFLASDDGGQVAELARTLPVTPVLELRLTDPDVVLSVDFGARALREGPAADASIRLKIEASAFHDILLERLDPVQISRVFEEDRAAADGAPEALVGLVRASGVIARCYRARLEELGRTDLLELSPAPNGAIWEGERAPRPVIGHPRPWQRPRATTPA